MNNIRVIGVIIALFPLRTMAQGVGNTMIFGYHGGSYSPAENKFGLNILTFSEGGIDISDNQVGEAFFNDTNAAISDENGHLLFYFNGIDIYNMDHAVMENGDTLNEYSTSGYDLPQGAIILPYAEQPGKYMLFHSREVYIENPLWGLEVYGLYYSVVDMTLNGGMGKVVQRSLPLILDTLDYGKLAVTRHANGRDWWLAVGDSHTNAFYRVLIDPAGAHNKGRQQIGTSREPNFGQAVFSPNGEKYALLNTLGSGFIYWQSIDVFDFDRCTGLFSNQRHIENQMAPFSSGNGGLVIAPNSRWMYVACNDSLFRYDLSAQETAQTRMLIDIYEPFSDPFPTKFHLGFLAPDDKIYFTTTSSSRTLHVIHRPDEEDIEACKFQQHGIRLLCNNANSLPTFANYRLGPLDGAICDSLGLDNTPVAWWYCDQDTLQHTRFEFRDLSYHNPDTWLWDFGDGNTSSERHPVHEFNQTGAFNVCLTVANENGSNTLCKTIYSTVPVQDNPEPAITANIYPQPFQDKLYILLETNLKPLQFRLLDLAGRPVLEQSIENNGMEIETASLPRGVYFWEIRSGSLVLKAGKKTKN